MSDENKKREISLSRAEFIYISHVRAFEIVKDFPRKCFGK